MHLDFMASPFLFFLFFTATTTSSHGNFPISESTIYSIQSALAKNTFTFVQLVHHYLTQIHSLNPLRSILELNPSALFDASDADGDRRSSPTKVGSTASLSCSCSVVGQDQHEADSGGDGQHREGEDIADEQREGAKNNDVSGGVHKGRGPTR